MTEKENKDILVNFHMSASEKADMEAMVKAKGTFNAPYMRDAIAEKNRRTKKELKRLEKED